MIKFDITSILFLNIHNLSGLVKMNLKSDNRVACLVKEKDPYCGDGIVQVDPNMNTKTMRYKLFLMMGKMKF